MNIRRGFFRLSVVLSTLITLASVALAFSMHSFSIAYMYILIFVLPIWVIYWAGVYIARGFQNRQP